MAKILIRKTTLPNLPKTVINCYTVMNTSEHKYGYVLSKQTKKGKRWGSAMLESQIVKNTIVYKYLTRQEAISDLVVLREYNPKTEPIKVIKK
jgi:hypothetical protein